MVIDVVVWNVRNLTQEYRVGGWDGLSNNRRVERVGFSLQKAFESSSAGALVLLLETGADAPEHVVRPLVSQFGTLPGAGSWFGMVSEPTGVYREEGGGPSAQPETYTVLFNKNILNEAVELLILESGSNYRGGCLVRYGERPLIAVIHAPSPNHPFEARLETTIGFASALTRRPDIKKSGIVLCGDFNMQEGRELEALRGELEECGFTLAGPVDAAESPLATSLRQISTQVREGEHGSQPYDLVWEYKGASREEGESREALVVPRSAQLLRPVFHKTASPREYEALLQWVAEEVQSRAGEMKKTIKSINAEVSRMAGASSSRAPASSSTSRSVPLLPEEVPALQARVRAALGRLCAAARSWSHSFGHSEELREAIEAAARMAGASPADDVRGKGKGKEADDGSEAEVEEGEGSSSVRVERRPSVFAVRSAYELRERAGGELKSANDWLEKVLGLALEQRAAWLRCEQPGLLRDMLTTYSNLERCLTLVNRGFRANRTPARVTRSMRRAEGLTHLEALGIRLLISDHLGVSFQMKIPGRAEREPGGKG